MASSGSPCPGHPSSPRALGEKPSVARVLLTAFDVWCAASPDVAPQLRESVLAQLVRALRERGRAEEVLVSVPLQLAASAARRDEAVMALCALPPCSEEALRF